MTSRDLYGLCCMEFYAGFSKGLLAPVVWLRASSLGHQILESIGPNSQSLKSPTSTKHFRLFFEHVRASIRKTKMKIKRDKGLGL